MTTFDPEMEFFELSKQPACTWEDLQRTTPPTDKGALTPNGPTNQEQCALRQGSMTDTRLDHAYPQETGAFLIDETFAQEPQGPLDLCNLASSQYPHFGDVSTFGDWTVIDESSIVSLASNNVFTPLPLQPNPFLTQPSYTVAEPGCSFQYIAPAPAAQTNVVDPPGLPSGTRGVVRRRPAETRIHCPAHGCTKTFRRAGDCRRHMRKHQPPNLRCIVANCDMKFDRMDKVRDHMRQGHKMAL